MNSIEILPLGGIGEFGMNCMGIRFGEDMIIVDAGMGFPEEAPFGVDICVPDFSFLDEFEDNIRALVLTHGHEDHIGAVPYFLKELNVPVYASRLTLAFIEDKFIEHKIRNANLIEVEPNDVIKEGAFEVEFINASHSLVECFSLAIKTPLGTIIHTGDYKIDDSPVIGKPYDLETLSRYGDEGVLALLGDSTNATVPGRTPSEEDVIPGLRNVFESAEGRLFVTTFSSSFHRIQILFDLAHELGRSACVLGRSMIRNVLIGEELGLLDIPIGLMVSLNESRSYPHDQIVYLATGSQGEQRSAMWNISTQSYRGLQIQDGDTVVISARMIPGNEARISKMIGAIYRAGGNIVEDKKNMIHVSGHPSQEDIRILTETARPKFLVPVHGEYRMLFRHRQFAIEELGFDEDNVVLIENGDRLELNEDAARVSESMDVETILIESDRTAEVDFETIRERKKIAYAGMIHLAIPCSKDKRELRGDFVIELTGINESLLTVEFEEDASKVLREAFGALNKKEKSDNELIEEKMRIVLRKYTQKIAKIKPIVVVNVVEVED